MCLIDASAQYAVKYFRVKLTVLAVSVLWPEMPLWIAISRSCHRSRGSWHSVLAWTAPGGRLWPGGKVCVHRDGGIIQIDFLPIFFSSRKLLPLSHSQRIHGRIKNLFAICGNVDKYIYVYILEFKKYISLMNTHMVYIYYLFSVATSTLISCSQQSMPK